MCRTNWLVCLLFTTIGNAITWEQLENTAAYRAAVRKSAIKTGLITIKKAYLASPDAAILFTAPALYVYNGKPLLRVGPVTQAAFVAAYTEAKQSVHIAPAAPVIPMLAAAPIGDLPAPALPVMLAPPAPIMANAPAAPIAVEHGHDGIHRCAACGKHCLTSRCLIGSCLCLGCTACIILKCTGLTKQAAQTASDTTVGTATEFTQEFITQAATSSLNAIKDTTQNITAELKNLEALQTCATAWGRFFAHFYGINCTHIKTE